MDPFTATHTQSNLTEAQLATRLTELEPKLISLFTPGNGAAEQAAFLSGDRVNPQHEYPALGVYEQAESIAGLSDLAVSLTTNAKGFTPEMRSAYLEKIEDSCAKSNLADAAKKLHRTPAPQHERAFMELNRAIYGEPDRATYLGLVAESRLAFSGLPLIGRAADIRGELFGLWPDSTQAPPRFTPAPSTVAWVQNVVWLLYGNMLSHVPQRQAKFVPTEVREVFEIVLRKEFGAVAADWKVVLSDCQSIQVSASERLVKIPKTRTPMEYQKLQGLVIHELGVHVLRSVAGEQSSLALLRLGLANYYDAEEGLARTMEQALEGVFKDAGIPYYLAASAAYFGGMDFRQTFEIMWRYLLLDGLKDIEVSDEEIAQARTDAYSKTMRIYRGTDTLPWFKDLAYYNGSIKTWEYLESIAGDDAQLGLLLSGKADMTNPVHWRLIYETHSA